MDSIQTNFLCTINIALLLYILHWYKLVSSFCISHAVLEDNHYRVSGLDFPAREESQRTWLALSSHNKNSSSSKHTNCLKSKFICMLSGISVTEYMALLVFHFLPRKQEWFRKNVLLYFRGSKRSLKKLGPIIVFICFQLCIIICFYNNNTIIVKSTAVKLISITSE